MSEQEGAGTGASLAAGRPLLHRIDHVGHAVVSLDDAIARYRELFDLEVVRREVIEVDGVREALLAVGDAWIQLLEPLHDDTPIGRFLARRGPGVHHVGYRVVDIGRTFAELSRRGARLVDDHPRGGSRGCTVAFVHPRDVLGVLVELVECPAD